MKQRKKKEKWEEHHHSVVNKHQAVSIASLVSTICCVSGFFLRLLGKANFTSAQLWWSFVVSSLPQPHLSSFVVGHLARGSFPDNLGWISINFCWCGTTVTSLPLVSRSNKIGSPGSCDSSLGGLFLLLRVVVAPNVCCFYLFYISLLTSQIPQHSMSCFNHSCY
jgi:hypothetical protein